MTATMIENLKKLAAQRIWADELYFDAAILSRRNFQEAYHGGFESGETILAREILNSLGIAW